MSIFYLIPQMVGAGALIKPLLGFAALRSGVMMVGAVVMLIVVTAGMVSTTYVQFIKGSLLVIFSAMLTVMILNRGFSPSRETRGNRSDVTGPSTGDAALQESGRHCDQLKSRRISTDRRSHGGWKERPYVRAQRPAIVKCQTCATGIRRRSVVCRKVRTDHERIAGEAQTLTIAPTARSSSTACRRAGRRRGGPRHRWDTVSELPGDRRQTTARSARCEFFSTLGRAKSCSGKR